MRLPRRRERLRLLAMTAPARQPSSRAAPCAAWRSHHAADDNNDSTNGQAAKRRKSRKKTLRSRPTYPRHPRNPRFSPLPSTIHHSLSTIHIPFSSLFLRLLRLFAASSIMAVGSQTSKRTLLDSESLRSEINMVSPELPGDGHNGSINGQAAKRRKRRKRKMNNNEWLRLSQNELADLQRSCAEVHKKPVLNPAGAEVAQ
jgi:hypothetical protein